MPTYEYRCRCGQEFERVLPVSEYASPQQCACGLQAQKMISKPLQVSVQRDCRYDSPIDGRPITSWAQRREDLARNGCQEYDPMMRQDYDRRIAREDAELDKSIEATVEAEIERMPAKKKEALAREIDSGATPTPERLSVPMPT